MNDRHTLRVTLPDEGDGDEGSWVLCRLCDGCWRPDAASQHVDGCPAGDLTGPTKADLRAREERALAVWHAPSNEEDFL